MCEHLMDAGYSATVYNRTTSKCDPLVAKGAKLAASPKEVGENSDIVFSIVGFPKDVRSVILGDDGALAGLRSGGIIVDMTTSEPSLAKEIAAAAGEKGAFAATPLYTSRARLGTCCANRTAFSAPLYSRLTRTCVLFVARVLTPRRLRRGRCARVGR